MLKNNTHIQTRTFINRLKNHEDIVHKCLLSFSLFVLCLVNIASALAHNESEDHSLNPNNNVIKYEAKSTGTQYLDNKKSDVIIKVLVEASNLRSSELEIGEITLPAGLNSAVHSHGAIEIFYVLSGQLEHVVNGNSHILKPGMVGIVRPEDTVSHRVTGEEDCRALVIWTPGGEIDRIKKNYNSRPAE
ncbi:MAG: hypothetical protein DHS20C13_28670 [Thermodesulfobacteriota bacterium]|nr:MAG: hypothetical protein DHS20C13_28670 [Thermodesulfobacteriota bacterium]